MIAAYTRTATHYKHFCMFGFAVLVVLENHAHAHLCAEISKVWQDRPPVTVATLSLDDGCLREGLSEWSFSLLYTSLFLWWLTFLIISCTLYNIQEKKSICCLCLNLSCRHFVTQNARHKQIWRRAGRTNSAVCLSDCTREHMHDFINALLSWKDLFQSRSLFTFYESTRWLLRSTKIFYILIDSWKRWIWKCICKQCLRKDILVVMWFQTHTDKKKKKKVSLFLFSPFCPSPHQSRGIKKKKTQQKIGNGFIYI